jgi:hypothetical protein
MVRSYGQESIKPKESLDWYDVTFFLWNGYDPRFCGTRGAAIACINNGLASGDVLAAYESFPRLIAELATKKDVTIKDDFPHENSADFTDDEYHVNLHAALDGYRRHLAQDPKDPGRVAAWKKVEACLSENDISDSNNQDAICKALYDNLLEFVTKFDHRKENCMVMTRVTSM